MGNADFLYEVRNVKFMRAHTRTSIIYARMFDCAIALHIYKIYY